MRGGINEENEEDSGRKPEKKKYRNVKKLYGKAYRKKYIKMQEISKAATSCGEKAG